MAEDTIKPDAQVPAPEQFKRWKLWTLFVCGFFLSWITLLMPGIVLEKALLPKPWKGPFSNHIYSEPRISIAADKLADRDPFFVKARKLCGTRSVSERLFRRQHTYVRRVDERIVEYDPLGHLYRSNIPFDGLGEVASEFTRNENGESTSKELDCLAKLGDSAALLVYPWLDHWEQSSAQSEQDRLEQAKQSNIKHLKQLEEWFQKYPITTVSCTDSDLPTYYVCDGLPGALLASLATARVVEACREARAEMPSPLVEINRLLSLALQRMDPPSAKDLMRVMTDDRSHLGAFYEGRCLL
ncbi:MAG: hypothetical protein H9535_14850 [Ignavibacteria bacterium]|nr:hypothetical protein [Ignavibacteria bacterium]